MSGEAIGPEQRGETQLPRSSGVTNQAASAGGVLQRVILAAGGTAGHLYPGVAVAEAIKERNPHAQILFVGTRYGVEAAVVPRLGYPLRLLSAAPYYGVSKLSHLKGVVEMSRGCLQARALIKEYQPQVVIGFGGFTSVPAIAAAASLGIPTAIHESNVSPGLATSILARVANEVYVGLRDCASELRRPTAVTGNPVRPDIAALSTVRRLPIGDRTIRVLVTTGSMGEEFFNRRVPEMIEALSQLGSGVEVWHQAGAGRARVHDAYEAMGVTATVEEFISNMPAALRWADIVVSRAGASMLAEVAAAGLPSIIVPLVGHARNHQADNAAAYARAGAGWFVPEHSWEPDRVAELVLDRLTRPDMVRRVSRAARHFVNPDAPREIVRRLELLVASAPQQRSGRQSGALARSLS